MQHTELTKSILMTPPELKDNGAFTTYNPVDTKGYGHLRVILATGVIDAATSAAPLLQEVDATAGTWVAITNAALAAAIADGDDDELYAIDVDLTKGRKRFIRCLVTAGNGTTGTNLAVIGILSRKTTDDHDGLATDAGLDELVSV
jgi:hypothetical protein